MLHEGAFRRLGGTPPVIVLNNFREGMLKLGVHGAPLNSLYRNLLARYGVVALPRRVHDPDLKGEVDSGIGHTQRTLLKGLYVETLEAAKAYLDQWERRWADTRNHCMTNRQVTEVCGGAATLVASAS